MSPSEREQVRKPAPMLAMTTTAFTLDGYKIIKSLGVVRGIIVRSRSLFGTMGASIQTLMAATSPSSPSSANKPVRRPLK